MKIFTGTDRAKELVMRDRMGEIHFKSYREMQAFMLKGNYNFDLPTEYIDAFPVKMRIDFGRMLGDCGFCKGASYVQPDDNYFFCSSCKNEAVGGKLRRVIFPDNLDEICAELLKRDAEVPQGLDPTQAACVAKGLSRSWNPGETVEDLEKQRRTNGI
jgi:hypothetical protein